MDFVRSYFFKNEPLISCPFLSSKLDSPLIKTHSILCGFLHIENVKKVSLQYFDYITGESNLDERNGQLIRGSLLKK